ncbi:MAG: exopolysaccharide biosynthesis protein [Rickettsiales bacterium]|nr:exopolysaccharide biosynthesis protein [Rickettsiales bacterium]
MVIKRFKKNRAASDVLEDAVRKYQADKVSIGELMSALAERGFGLLLVIFVLPNCVPVPAPGLTSLTAVPLAFLAAQMLIGRDVPWLPSWINNRQIRRSLLAKMVEKAAPRMKKIEKLLRARLSFASSTTGERVVGSCCLLFSACIAVPLPWTNFVPGLGVLIMSLGLLSRDGITIIIGIIVGLIGVAGTSFVLLFGMEALKALLG